MFKKLIAGALGMVTLVTVGAMGVSAEENYDPIVNSSQNYHYCKPGTCQHEYRGGGLGLYPYGKWGSVCSTLDDHQDSYKYISVTTYGITADNKYYVKKTVRNGSAKNVVISPDATIDGSVAKVVYNGQIYRTSEETSGMLKKYLVGSFRSKCPIK